MRLPNFAAEDGTRRFSADLYLEHLEEASFLYDQRLGLYDDPEVTWLDIGKFEDRLEAHLEALVSGGELALEICVRRSEEGDPGELYTAVCVFCRHQRRDLLGVVLKRLDLKDSLRSTAVRDAITDEMPEEWGEVLATSLNRGYDKLIPMVAHFVGHRRLASASVDELIARPRVTDGLAELLWAWGRVGEARTASHVAGYVDHEDSAVRTNAVIALLRRGDDGALAACSARALDGDPAMCLPLAVCAGPSALGLLHNFVLQPSVTPATLIALGVLGDLKAVRPLIEKLTDEKLGAAAAVALQLMTGAPLRENAFIPDVVDEDELFEDEQETYLQTGEVPKRIDDRPFGVNVERTSQNPEDWVEWLEEHKADFSPSQRYRLGKPFSLSSLVDTLASPLFGRVVRALAYEELVIRYRIDAPFEPEMRVNEQKGRINTIARLCRSTEASFEPGEWYCGGKLA
jgi:uncharacterized protein (TIGR02270 family)